MGFVGLTLSHSRKHFFRITGQLMCAIVVFLVHSTRTTFCPLGIWCLDLLSIHSLRNKVKARLYLDKICILFKICHDYIFYSVFIFSRKSLSVVSSPVTAPTTQVKKKNKQLGD